MPYVDWRDRDVLRAAVGSAKRILVAGNAGAGKTTLCRTLAAATGLDYTELDSLYFGPRWTKRESFEARALALAAGDEWITEWQYPVAREALAARADLFIWLDLPRWLCVLRVVKRSVRRRLSGPRWWNGNTEPPLRQLLTNRYHTARWSFRHHHDNRRLASAQVTAAAIPVIRAGSAGQLSELTRCLRAARRCAGVDGCDFGAARRNPAQAIVRHAVRGEESAVSGSVLRPRDGSGGDA